MKKIIITLVLILFSIFNIYAENNKISNSKLNLNINNNIKMGEELKIDLSKIKEELSQKYNSKIDFEWSLEGSTIKKGAIYKKVFDKYGEKKLSLNIYSLERGGKKLIDTKKINLFIFKDINYIILENKKDFIEKYNLYKEKAKNEGVYTKEILKISEDDINQKNIISTISKLNLDTKKGNYITIWGDKNFIFSIISKINKEVKNQNYKDNLNLVLLTPFNTDVLEKYIVNFISNKKWINKILLLPETSKSQIWLNPNNIFTLEQNLKKKKYEYVNINTNSKISDLLFISKFVNLLSNNGFSNKYIYLIILIPFLLTGISVFKHLIGLSPIGITIPIILTLLIFQIGLLATGIILFSIILINLLLGKITNKYTLLYTPKISFIVIINIIFIILILDFLFMYNILKINITDTLFIIFFIIISERLITIVLSKEFSEYKYNLFNTILFSIISYLILNISFIQTIILAYPEIILFLIPINFIIGKFTGLRITEYFRFREVIKSIEEE